jgi:hypothetical protein
MNNNVVIDCRCTKITYQTHSAAKIEVDRILALNRNNIMYIYKCNTCSKFHLTKKSPKFFKHRQKYNSDIRYRNKYNEQKFIERETQKWEEHFQKLTK